MPRDRTDQHSADESCLVGAPPNAFQVTATSNLPQDWLQSQVNLSLTQRSEPNPDLPNDSHQLSSSSNSAVTFNDFPTSNQDLLQWKDWLKKKDWLTNMPTDPGIPFRRNSYYPLRNTDRFNNHSLFQRDIPTKNTSVNNYSGERSSMNIGENQLNNAMLLQYSSYNILQGFPSLGIPNHDASSRNGTYYNDFAPLKWINDRQSVLPGTSIGDTRQRSTPQFNERGTQFDHVTQNMYRGNFTSSTSSPSLHRAGSDNNNISSAVGNRELSNQMYNPNAFKATHANNMKPAIQNNNKVIYVPERRFSSDPEASAKHTYLEGPLVSGICVVSINTLLFICLKDENRKPCSNHGGYIVSVDPAQSVQIRSYLADYKSSTIMYGILVGKKHRHKYKLSVMFGDDHVVGSPLEFYVVPVESSQIPCQYNNVNSSVPTRTAHKVWGISDTGLRTILVADRNCNEVFEYNHDMTLKRIISAGFKNPSKAMYIYIPTKSLGTIIVADKDNHRVVMIGYDYKEYITEFSDCKHPWDLCSIGHNNRSVCYILVTHSETISVLDLDLIPVLRIQSPDIKSPRGICRGYLNHVIVTDFNTNELVVLEIKLKLKLEWDIVRRIFLNPQNKPNKNPGTKTLIPDRLEGVTLDKGSGCILVCDSGRCSVKVVSYLLHHFTDLKEIEGEAMGVIGIKDGIYVTTLSRLEERPLTSSNVVVRDSIFRVLS